MWIEWLDSDPQAYVDAAGLMMHPRSHGRPFLLADAYCQNPDCDCNEVQVTLTEAETDGWPREDPIEIHMHVDLDTWQERDPPDRPEAEDRIAKEFLADLPDAAKDRFLRNYAAPRETVRRLREYRVEPGEVRKGTLVCYPEVVSGAGSVLYGGTGYTVEVTVDGQRWLVCDEYCPNPDCDCREVYLVFLHVDGDTAVEHFRARQPFGGRPVVEADKMVGRDRAARVLEAWGEQAEDISEVFEARYEDVKAIGRRSLASAKPTPPPAPGLSVAQPTAGRNDPCPCGSGRKYKKCCGA